VARSRCRSIRFRAKRRPFSREAPALAFSLPLFIVLLLAVAVGVVIGGTVVGWQIAVAFPRAPRRA